MSSSIRLRRRLSSLYHNDGVKLPEMASGKFIVNCSSNDRLRSRFHKAYCGLSPLGFNRHRHRSTRRWQPKQLSELCDTGDEHRFIAMSLS